MASAQEVAGELAPLLSIKFLRIEDATHFPASSVAGEAGVLIELQKAVDADLVIRFGSAKSINIGNKRMKGITTLRLSRAKSLSGVNSTTQQTSEKVESLHHAKSDGEGVVDRTTTSNLESLKSLESRRAAKIAQEFDIREVHAQSIDAPYEYRLGVLTFPTFIDSFTYSAEIISLGFTKQPAKTLWLCQWPCAYGTGDWWTMALQPQDASTTFTEAANAPMDAVWLGSDYDVELATLNPKVPQMNTDDTSAPDNLSYDIPPTRGQDTTQQVPSDDEPIDPSYETFADPFAFDLGTDGTIPLTQAAQSNMISNPQSSTNVYTPQPQTGFYNLQPQTGINIPQSQTGIYVPQTQTGISNPQPPTNMGNPQPLAKRRIAPTTINMADFPVNETAQDILHSDPEMVIHARMLELARNYTNSTIFQAFNKTLRDTNRAEMRHVSTISKRIHNAIKHEAKATNQTEDAVKMALNLIRAINQLPPYGV